MVAERTLRKGARLDPETLEHFASNPETGSPETIGLEAYMRSGSESIYRLAYNSPILSTAQEKMLFEARDQLEKKLRSTTSVDSSESLAKKAFRDVVGNRSFWYSCKEGEFERMINIVANCGESIDELLILSNLRLVLEIAKRHIGHGVELEDLFQEGIFGLRRAIQKFEIERGFKFSTYATNWIKQAIGSAVIEQGKFVRVPNNLAGKLKRLSRAVVEYQQQNGRYPKTDQEVVECIRQIYPDIKDSTVQLMVDTWGSDVADVDSLDRAVYRDGETRLVDLLAGDDDTEEEVTKSITFQEVYDQVKELVREHYNKKGKRKYEKGEVGDFERDWEIFVLRRGLENGKEYSFDEVCVEVGVSRETAKQCARRIERVVEKHLRRRTFSRRT